MYKYEIQGHVLYKYEDLISYPILKLIDNYVQASFKFIKQGVKLPKFMSTILKRKITDYLIYGKLETKTNNDVIEYRDEESPYYIDSLISETELFMKLEVYKYTGITYTEWMRLTKIERELILDFLNYKLSIKELATDGIEKKLDNEDKNLNENLMLFDHRRK